MSAPRYVLALLLALAMPGFSRLAAQVAPMQQPSAPSWRYARVTYVTGRSVYVDQGLRGGIREGARLDVMRGGRAIASLRATNLSSDRAACEIVSASADVVVGDSVRYLPAADSLTTPRTPVVADEPGDTTIEIDDEPLERARRMRGRIGVRQLYVAQRDSATGHMSQPAADVRLDAPSIAGTPIGVALDVRGRRTSATTAAGVTTRASTLVYQAALSWQSEGAGARVTLGRQFSEALSDVALFDGLSAHFQWTHAGVGAFAGLQPDPSDLGVSSDLREFGGYFIVRGGEDAHWAVTTGAVGSYALGEIDREFVYSQLSVTHRRFSLFAIQQADVFRGWKRDSSQAAIAPTATYLSARVEVTDALSLYAGADGRRSVRLYRDRLTPENQFDDALRRGAWGGAALRLANVFRISADGRASEAGDGGRASSGTLTLAANSLTRFGFGGRIRSTAFSTSRATGWLYAAALSANPWSPLRVELEGGGRDEHMRPGFATVDPSTTTRVRWLGLEADVGLGGAWYLLLSATRERGGWESADQVYSSITYRF